MTFYMLVGIAGSGKSTIAAQLAAKTDAIVVSSDAIRAELYGDEAIQGSAVTVFRIMKDRTHANLAAGRSVIYDATNVQAWRRQELLSQLPEEVKKVCVWVDTPTKRALRNNLHRDRHVPDWVIRQQADQLEPPTAAEGWDDIRIVSS